MRFIPVAEPDLSQLEVEYVTDAVKSGWVSSLGAYIDRFERDFARLCGTKYAVSVSNGTVGLHLALVAIGVKPGDEVIVPSFSFVATAAAVLHAGATPVFVDCDASFGIMDPDALSNAITEKTKAIIVVHLYGHPCDMDRINTVAAKHGVPVIEDAAEAHGARYRTRIVGGLSLAGVFSFYGNKVITTGEGGVITTNDSSLDGRLRFLRDHAMDKNRRYWHPEVGYNYRITNLQAALGVAQIERFDEIFERRMNVLSQYKQSEISKSFGIQFNPSDENSQPTPWLVCAWLPPLLAPSRTKICLALRQRGIDSRLFFEPIHGMPPYQQFRCVAADGTSVLAKTNELTQRGVCLPSSPSLSSADIQYIVRELTCVLSEIHLNETRQ